MSWINLLTSIYRGLTRLYPPRFRQDFAEEMQAVFAQALQDSAAGGSPALTLTFLRELGSLPASLMREHWKWFARYEAALTEIDDRHPGDWGSAILAGLPHLLYALALYLPVSILPQLNMPLGWRSGLSFFWLVLALVLAYARLRKWPRWSHTWIGYGLVFLLHQVITYFPGGPLANLTIVTWLSLVGIILVWLAMRDWLGGLLSVLPITPMFVWWTAMDGIRGDESLVYYAIGALVSLVVVVIVRVGRWQTAVWLMLAVILAAGLPVSYGTTFFSNMPYPYQPNPAPWTVARGVLIDYMVMAVFTAPLWMVAFWRVARRARLKPQ
jgi:hypothetical protein